ncbi:hypothetical protein BS47DRAFT_1308135, partial [Hydnum rufescens UP504]
LKYALGVAKGKYQGSDIFLGLIHAQVLGSERKEHGKALNGMKYAPALDALCHSLYAKSPSCYKLLCKYFNLRSPCSLL